MCRQLDSDALSDGLRQVPDTCQHVITWTSAVLMDGSASSILTGMAPTGSQRVVLASGYQINQCTWTETKEGAL
jgi:hypothetical protein